MRRAIEKICCKKQSGRSTTHRMIEIAHDKKIPSIASPEALGR
jgi:hypothetical protein